jgi:hypothetical protein
MLHFYLSMECNQVIPARIFNLPLHNLAGFFLEESWAYRQQLSNPTTI